MDVRSRETVVALVRDTSEDAAVSSRGSLEDARTSARRRPVAARGMRADIATSRGRLDETRLVNDPAAREEDAATCASATANMALGVIGGEVGRPRAGACASQANRSASVLSNRASRVFHVSISQHLSLDEREKPEKASSSAFHAATSGAHFVGMQAPSMQAPTVPSGTLARPSASRFSAGAVATPRAVRVSAAGARLGARRFQAVVDRRRLVAVTAVSTRPHPPPSHAAARRLAGSRFALSETPRPDASLRPGASTRAGALARRASHVTSAGSRRLSEFPVADRRAELNGMKMAQLKPLCKGSGLIQGGKKQELIARLLEHEFGTTDDEADIDPKDDIVGLAAEWRDGRAAATGVSFGEMDRVEGALSSMEFVDERAADAAFYEQGFDDGGYARSSEARGDQGVGASSAAARVMGRDGGGFDDGGGAGWGDDGGGARDWYAEEEQFAPAKEELTAEARAEAKRKAALKAERSLERRSAIVTALRTLATEREGFESDPRVHLEAVSRAIERAYRNMRHSAFAKMDDRGRDVCVDINVATGTLAILAQRVGRGGTVEWEIDDTEAFLEAHSKRHQIRKLAFAFTEEINEAVSAAAAESYLARDGEMVEATVVAQGRDGEILLKLKDGAFACLPPEEAIPDKRYAQGDRVCALVIGVEPRTWAADKRAPVLVSCGIAGLLAEVLKAEVPEVADGSVVIKGVSRVSGKMSKVAVAAGDLSDRSAVDPVLACVGAENARLRAIRERLGGEVCQILPWREDPEAFVAEALFPAVIQRVTQMDAAGTLDERGNARRMSKFVAYVNRFDEAKAIGAAGINVKLAAALCGCFIMVERHKEPRASDAESGGWGNAEDDEADDRWMRDTRDSDAWASHTAGAPIDLTDDGLDELGWPDLEPATRDPTIAASVGSLDESRIALDESAMDPRDDDANWEEVGPGKVGVVTFGGNLGLGIAGGCSFMGDPEEFEAERLGDAAEAAAFEGLGGAAFEAEDENGFFSDGADDADLFADDDLFGEDWNQ